MEKERDRTMFWLMGFLSLQSNGPYNQLLHLLYVAWRFCRDGLSTFSHIDVPETEGSAHTMAPNELYRSVALYLGSLDATASAPRVAVTRYSSRTNVSYSLPSGHTVKDEFRGAQVWWTHEINTEENRDQNAPAECKFVLKISNKDRERLLTPYLDHISKQAEDIQRRSQDRRLFTNGGQRSRWVSVGFRHPSTFETLALDPVLKDKIVRDLDRFAQSRDFYRKIGRPWKRGYLLYGPPGTGKSSLIAAIANYMNYDVYDLDLTKVADNSVLRELLLETVNKSVIVIEDIDCSAVLSGTVISRSAGPSEQTKECGAGGDLTLSGLLNFADGLWSSCVEERILIFTTNHREKLDPALLRCGRMDMHILLSHCVFPAFKQLAFNYLGISDHFLFPLVEEKMQGGGGLTPAEICELLLVDKDDPDSALNAVIAALEGSVLSRGATTEPGQNHLTEAILNDVTVRAREGEDLTQK